MCFKKIIKSTLWKLNGLNSFSTHFVGENVDLGTIHVSLYRKNMNQFITMVISNMIYLHYILYLNISANCNLRN